MSKNWFSVKKLENNIWGIGEFNHFEKVISYLIDGRREALLFDTGMGIENIGKIVNKITPSEVVVLNSHCHYDHVGGNSLFPNIFDVSNNKDKEISVGDYRFKVLLCPGHSPDSVCLYEEKMGYLFAGDTLYPGPIYLHTEESNKEDYKKSIQKLLKLPKISRIFPGHNDFRMKLNSIKKIDKILSRKIGINEKSIKVDDRTSLLLK